MGQQPYVSSIPPLFRRGETPLYIPSLAPPPPDVDRFPSSVIHLPRRPSDPLDPSSRYRLNTRSHSARITRSVSSSCWCLDLDFFFRFSSASRLTERKKQFVENREKSDLESFEFDPSNIYQMIEERG